MNNGDRVRVISQDGNVAAVGVYYGTGIPTKDLNAKLNVPHYAILVEGETTLRYFPTGYTTLILDPKR